MEGKGEMGRPSPLRNSKAANRPFQSPLRSVLKRTDDSLPKNSHASPRNFTTPEKRISGQPYSQAKKLCEESTLPVKSDKQLDEESIDENDLIKLRERISSKEKEIEHIKQQLLYEKKHESRNLKDITERWLQGCQEALSEFQKDISRDTGAVVSMTEILRQLGIPAELVKYSDDECDFV